MQIFLGYSYDVIEQVFVPTWYIEPVSWEECEEILNAD